ncbi:MAG: hypothetical protein M1561_00300, partial [Gammaproteobacteria bacterium]|nr:hypothetical protein [Gammaproteobacteria bacterium]
YILVLRTSLLRPRARTRSDVGADTTIHTLTYPTFNYSLLPASDSSAALVASGTNPSINSADAKAGTDTNSGCHWCRCM